MSSNKHLKVQAISLRLKGYSYNNIIKSLGIKSKGTLNSWFKNLMNSCRPKDLLNSLEKRYLIFLSSATLQASRL